jgi:hypothetical protein
VDNAESVKVVAEAVHCPQLEVADRCSDLNRVASRVWKTQSCWRLYSSVLPQFSRLPQFFRLLQFFR